MAVSIPLMSRLPMVQMVRMPQYSSSLAEVPRPLPHHAEDGERAQERGSQHDGERGVDGLARCTCIPCGVIFRHKLADGRLQSQVEKIHIGAELQDEHPGAVLRRAHVV